MQGGTIREHCLQEKDTFCCQLEHFERGVKGVQTEIGSFTSLLVELFSNEEVEEPWQDTADPVRRLQGLTQHLVRL